MSNLSTPTHAQTIDRIPTGVPGIDEILGGGVIPHRGYMIRGRPGTGKTVLGLHFLLHGVANDEPVLYIALEETEQEIRQNARSIGFDLDGIEFLDLTPSSDVFAEDESYDVFDPSEVEQQDMVTRITDTVEGTEPTRVVIDPITQFRFLQPDQYQFRKHILSLTRFFSDRGSTVLFTSQASEQAPDDDLQFMADGVFHLSHRAGGRRLTVPKFRGGDAMGGTHAFKLTDDGMQVFPELYPEKDRQAEFDPVALPSGVPELDQLLHGGLERGTVTIVAGPTGVGKTTLGTQFVKEAAGRGDRSAIYLFDESKQTFLTRLESINVPVKQMRSQETLEIAEIEALEQSPQEFARTVSEDVEAADTKIVMIDGVPGYKQSMQGDSADLTRRLHQLTRYLRQHGVTVILTEEVAAVTGEFAATETNVSYLADNIVFFRYIEVDGELKKVIGVLKKRASDFERTLREFRITEHGLKVGEPLPGLRNILSGTPEWADSTTEPGRNDGQK